MDNKYYKSIKLDTSLFKHNNIKFIYVICLPKYSVTIFGMKEAFRMKGRKEDNAFVLLQ